jgi:hypothetical protein
MLRANAAVLGSVLAPLFNACLACGVFPHVWKAGFVVPIPKPAGGLRPITLLPIIGKLFERVLARRLARLADQHAWLSDAQFAYRPSRSCTDALSVLFNFVHEGFARKLRPVALMVDFSKAFDRIPHGRICDKLDALCCPTDIAYCIRGFLADRSASLSVASHRASVGLLSGCPQGSVLGPLLWNFCVDDLIRILEDAGCCVICYADDITILSSFADPSDVSRWVSKCIFLIDRWAQEYDQRVNMTKTHCMFFAPRGRPRGLPISVPTSLGNVSVLDRCKLLGITLDSRLSLKPHFTSKCAQARAVMVRCRSLFLKHGFVPVRSMRAIYRVVVLPLILYASPATAFAMRSPAIRDLVLAVARLAAVLLTGCLRSSATGSLLSLARLGHPADLFIASCVSHRLSSSDRSYGFAMSVLSGSPGGHPLLRAASFAKLLPGSLEEPGKRSRLPVCTAIPSMTPDLTVAFADGSCTASACGAAVFCDGVSVSVRFSALCGPLVAELIALLLAFTEFSPDVVVSDSIRALNMISDGEIRHPVASLCRSIAVESSCSLVWRPRCSSEELRCADSLARFASARGKQHWTVPGDPRHIRSASVNALSCSSDLKEASSRLRQCFVSKPHHAAIYAKWELHGTAARLIVGSAITPAVLHRWGRRSSAACVCGADYGDAVHALFECCLVGSIVALPTLPVTKDVLRVCVERFGRFCVLNGY